MKKTFSETLAPSFNGRRFLWSASLLSLCILPACSDSDDDDLPKGGEPTAPELITSALEVDADAAAQAQRVTNFRGNVTRAVADETNKVLTLQADEKLPAEIPAGTTYKVSGEIALTEGSTLTIKGGLTSDGTVALPGVTVVVDGGTLDVPYLIAPNVVVNSGTANLAKVLIAQGVDIKGGKVALAQDASFPVLSVAGKAEVAVATGKTLTVEGTLNLASDSVKFTTDVASKAYSYISAKLLSLASNDLTTNFGYGYFVVLGDSLELNGAGTASSSLLQPASLTLLTSIKEFNAWKPTTGTATKTILEQVSIIKNSDDKAGLSATGIAVDGDKVYVSFHTRDSVVNGAIDVATIESDGSIKLNKTLSSTADNKFEFNHIAVAGGKVYAVGSRENNGYTADGTAKTGTQGVIGILDTEGESLSTRSLYGGDGNSIILNGDYLQVASIYGLETYAVDGLRRESAVATNGHAKSIIRNGSDVVVLRYDGESSASTAYTDSKGAALVQTPFVVETYSAYDYTFETPSSLSASFTASTIVPINGKNTIAADGSVYYVAAGANGVLTSDGQSFKVARKTDTKVPAGYANSIAVDDNYVYVAYGAAGVYVLNKSDLSEVASYTNTAGKSANFVAVSNGKIFVAYGQDSWQVLQLATVTK